MSATNEPVVICNLERGGRTKRLSFGLVIAALTVYAAWYLHAQQAPLYFRALLFIPWLAAATGVVQAAHGTCIALAATGMREGPEGLVRDLDAEHLAAVRKRAGLVRLQATGIALVLTFSGMLLR